MRYRCVAARKAEGFPVTRDCQAVGVSRSAFCDWQSRPDGPTRAQVEEAHLLNDIIDIHRGSDGTYGEPRVAPDLHERGCGQPQAG
jgi:putative transposase